MSSAHPAARRGVGEAAAGLFALTVAALFSWVPSYWKDEVASLEAARLSWRQLWTLLMHVDVGNGEYYGLLHVWLKVFGSSEFSTRFLSAILVGCAAAGVVAIGRLLGSWHSGVFGAVVFAVLPRTTYMGSEARSYALATALATGSCVALLVFEHRRTWASWCGYVGVGVALGYAFMPALLILMAHGVYAACTSDQLFRKWWSLGAGCTVAAMAPLAFADWRERAQLAWIAHSPGANGWTVLVEPWFDESVLAAIAGWALIVFAVTRFRRNPPAMRPRGYWLLMVWAFGPLAVEVGVSLAGGQYYLARYTSFTTPAIGLLIGVSLANMRYHRLGILGLAVFVAMTGGSYAMQRGPTSRGDSDLREIAQTIGRHAQPGDAVALDYGGEGPRFAQYAYTQDFRGLFDIRLKTSYDNNGTLRDTLYQVEQRPRQLAAVHRIWIASGMDGQVDDRDARYFYTMGFHVRARYRNEKSIVYLLTR
jgi:mannosyltransferase